MEYFYRMAYELALGKFHSRVLIDLNNLAHT
jgi:hypothetical protein